MKVRKRGEKRENKREAYWNRVRQSSQKQSLTMQECNKGPKTLWTLINQRQTIVFFVLFCFLGISKNKNENKKKKQKKTFPSERLRLIKRINK